MTARLEAFALYPLAAAALTPRAAVALLTAGLGLIGLGAWLTKTTKTPGGNPS